LRSKCQGVAENLASICTTKSPSDVTSGTGNADSDFTTVRNTKFSSKMRSDQPVINTYNRFEEFNNPELFDEEIHEMHCPKAKAMTNDKDLKNLSVKTFIRKARSSKAKIQVYDRLEDSSCKKIDQVIDGDEMNKKNNVSESVEIDEYKVQKSRNWKFIRRAPLTKLKIKSYSLKKFEGENCFSILENNAEEVIEKLIDERLNIIKMKKAQLNKCKNCNFKNRSCTLDRSSCPALKKI
jgi:hypothetical protein